MYPAFLSLLCPLQASACTYRDVAMQAVQGVDDWQFQTFSSVAALKAGWPVAGRADDFWLREETLEFLMTHPQGMDTQAIVLENCRDRRRVLLTAQRFSFSAAGQVSDAAKGTTSRYDLRRRLLAPFSFRVLCLGQFLTSGPFGQDGLEQLTAAEASRVLPALADTLLACQSGYAAVLLKDLFPPEHPTVRKLEAQGFFALPVDPIMQLHRRPDWHQFEDYLAALTSKYRVRYRRARNKLSGLRRKRLSPEDVDRYRDRMYVLYRNTSSKADFNAATLTHAYFPWLVRTGGAKQSIPADPLDGLRQCLEPASEAAVRQGNRLHGYFTDTGALVGFTSAIENGPVLHAHYLGMEDAYKYSHHLYHNMLFDLLAEAIAGGFATVDFGRTALEIKSSVGAIPVHTTCLVRSRNSWVNRLIPFFTPAVYRAEDWTPRNPFK